ncbi:MAG: PaaI family thioesterase [Dehalococcoidia bacterium]|nr:PaaI family thioesterase [Dehalococcoidia bacterium]
MERELQNRLRWLPHEAPPSARRESRQRMAAALRRAIAALIATDPAPADLDALSELAEKLADRLESGPEREISYGFAESANADTPRFEFDASPLMGPGNPIAPPLQMQWKDDCVVGTAVFGQQYEGPPGHVHGGFVAAAFDEVLGMAQSLSGQSGMTGRLVVHYRKPTPLHRELRFEGRVEKREGRKIFTTATLHDGETLCAEAEGLFIQVDLARLERFARGD